MTANEEIRDAALRHQVHVRRFATQQANKMLELLERADRDVVKQLREGLKKILAAGGDPRDSRNIRRLKALLEEIRRERERVLRAIEKGIAPEMVEFGKIEAEFERKVFDRAIPIAIDLPKVTPRKVKAIVETQPFAGRALGDWWKSLRESDQRRVLEQIRIGHLEGQTIPQIVRRIAGTRAGRFKDGALSVTRRQAEAIVRTGVNGISNAVRNETWKQMGDAIDGLVWTSNLDGRTSAICRARDGHIRPVSAGQPVPDSITLPRLKPPLASPPSHPNCRSVLVGYTGVGLLGERPFVRDKRNRRRREMDFRAQARDKAGADWRGMSEKDRRRLIAKEREAWAAENIGRVPAAEDYDTWLRKQPHAFQDDVLGKTRGKLFRKGNLKMDQFVDFAGDELTLDELRKLHPGVFDRAGV